MNKQINYYSGENPKKIDISFDVILDEDTYYTIVALENLGYNRSNYFDCVMINRLSGDIYDNLDVIEKEKNKLINTDKKKNKK
jgi:hypothetical protein